MYKFLFVSGSYDPYPKANGVCAKAVEEELKKRGHQVIYIVTRNNITQKNVEVINGNKVFFIPRTIHEIHRSFDEMRRSFSKESPQKYILKFTHVVLKMLFFIVAYVQGKSLRNAAESIYKQNFTRFMSDLISIEKPDGILTFSVPFSSHVFTHEVLKKTNYRTLWACFLLDAHQYNSSITSRQKNEFAKEEAIVFENAKLLFLLDVLKVSYDKRLAKKYTHKLNYFKLPFLNIPLNYNMNESYGIAKDKDSIDITFAGSLYDDFRPIDYFSAFIRECKGLNIRFHIMGKIYPKTLQILDELVNYMPSQIKLYGFVSRDFVLNSLSRSDILVNIGNNNIDQIPSKIIEYIGIQKPLFSFVSHDKDPTLQYLERYPHAHIIYTKKEDPMKIVVNEAIAFYENCKSDPINTTMLRKNFKGYLQEDVADEIAEIVVNRLNDKK